MAYNNIRLTWGGAAAFAAATIPQPAKYRASAMTAPPAQQAAPSPSTTATATIDERLLSARLEAVEARTETKFAQLLGEIRLLGQSLAGLDKSVGDVKSDIGNLKTDVSGVRSATAGVKWNILATGLVLGGLIIAIAAFGAQMLDLAMSLVQVR